MIVIADTSPINYLVLIEAIEVLPELFGEVIIPQAVFVELNHPKASQTVRNFIADKPKWLKVVNVNVPPNSGLENLDYGEREAIYLAELQKADLVVIDERKGFQEAERRNLIVVGTLFVLESAAENGLLDLKEAIEKLKKTSFRIAPKILEEILDRFYK